MQGVTKWLTNVYSSYFEYEMRIKRIFIRGELRGGHIHFRIWVNGGCCGELVMRDYEFYHFTKIINLGILNIKDDIKFELELDGKKREYLEVWNKLE